MGVGKTAVLVELTRMLAQQSAVPVPLRLRDMDGEFDFEQMARRRFAEEADQGVFAAGNIDKAWRQLRLDDKAVVIADGLEEALLDERYREDRDNIIRRAIDRADRQQLPLVIASRPHAPLEGTRAAITDLEPLSEEAALEYLVREPGEGDERRLDWVVETAEVSDSPIYLRIARALQQRGLLEHLTLREHDGRLNTRSNDCSTIRLWLLDSYRRAMEDGLIRDKLVMDRRERRETLWVVSALACLGLLQDTLEVSFDDFVGAYLDDLRERRRSGTRPGEPSAGSWRDTVRTAVTPAQREAIWNVLARTVGESSSWINPLDDPTECYAELARYAANGQHLGLVRGSENKVRFPHSIVQAYLGHRLLTEVPDDQMAAVVGPALRGPGPSRELLIALVLLSRHRATTAAPRPSGRRDGSAPRTSELLRDAAADRHDAKYFDLYAAALEIDSIDPEPLQDELARTLDEQWEGLVIRSDQRTVEDAKLGLVRRFGAALRERERRRNEAAGTPPGTAAAPPPLPYERLLSIGTHEPSHAVRTAIAHQIAAGGDAAFRALRELFPLDTDPVRQYLHQTREAKGKLNEDYTAWLEDTESGRAAAPGTAERRERQYARFVREHEQRRTVQWRHFALRAWLVPMFLGSVSARYRGEAEERLDLWLRHLTVAAGRDGAPGPSTGPPEPDLPLSFEIAMTQGFKNAANRRRRHPGVHEESRAFLTRHAERMLASSRSWYAQLSLLHALCLWELPDTAGRGDAPAGQGASVEPVRAVTRWLAVAGSARRGAGDGEGRRAMLHPFVAEAGDLVTLALETGHPEQFLWIDEHGAVGSVGSTPLPALTRRTAPWVSIPVRELHAFWEVMAHRKRKAPEEDEQVL
ncbi:hypothetical protein SALBM217S_00651 [Streptomyces griseoloalbus]